MPYELTTPTVNFPNLEKEILAYWRENNIFQKSVNSKGNKQFVFYDGPPFANGLPHYGHLLTGFVKDTFARYQTMLGKKVNRRFGWDCHGLPAEMGVEKNLGISGKKAIEAYGIAKFNQECKKSVLQFSSSWQQYVERQARWVDFINDYKTLDLSFMESVIWAFNELYKKGLIYESVKVLPYSWACETALSNFETRMDNCYRPKTSKAVTVAFNLLEAPSSLKGLAEHYKMLVWTTTPWTLPSNLALVINSNLNYSAVLENNTCYIAASFYNKAESTINIPSIELINLKYQPLFNYFKDTPNAFKVLNATFVTEGEGTGIVHAAPGFGEEDFELCQKNNIPFVCPVDDSGKFTSAVTDFANMHVFDANDEIIKFLKNSKNWVKTEQYTHNYPHCWRTDTPLIYKAVPSWYVRVTEIKNQMIENNKEINWKPAHIKNGLFGKWLENAKDWSISRKRFWGTPIPVWKSDDPTYPRIDVYGSLQQLEEDFGVKLKDLHRPYIDELTRINPDDPTGISKMKRVTDVFDCWFESGSMPFGQVHYPFENKEWFESHFPADFITEYISQTRGWFYTLLVLSTALFNKPPFKNCLCHGVVLDTAGQKLSKRLNNYTDPTIVFEKYGADAIRFLMLSSTVMHGGELLLDKNADMVKEVIRLVLNPLWSAYHFFTLYARADKIEATISFNTNNLMDQYILNKCLETCLILQNFLDEYDSVGACKAVIELIEVLNNWYIRGNRERFWRSTKDENKVNAYNTLFTFFNYFLRVVAPLLPLTTEHIWLHLFKTESIHLEDFPIINKSNLDNCLITNMDIVRDICNTALFIRNKCNIRIRQTLAELQIYTTENIDLTKYFDIVKEEVNVKAVTIHKDIEKATKHTIKIHFPIVGKRYPSLVKKIIQAEKTNNWEINNSNQLSIAGILLNSDEFEVLLSTESDNCSTTASGKIVIRLNVDITQELLLEGKARDLVRLIQQARKEGNLNITDKINIVMQTNEDLTAVLASWKDYIQTQTLAESLILGKCNNSKLIFNSENITIGIN